MSSLGERLAAAIKASGKTRAQIAEEAGTTEDTISRITTGKHDNPELQLLIRLARGAKTRVGALLGESLELSAEDEQELLRFRGWIDEQLATIDARREPNAVILRTTARPEIQGSLVADRPRQASPPPVQNPFDGNVQLVLRAAGESMKGAGILADDTLYAVAPDSAAAPIGKVIACRIGEDVFVKRLVTEHGRKFLLSAHPRYQPIAIAPNADSFEILGVVVGRVGRID